jgi:DNA-binding Lrp family transcriptional regulator
MDEIDKNLLNAIQCDFPIVHRPYAVLGERFGLTEEETLTRVRGLVESGVIRRIGPSFDSRKLGYVSMLVAAKVPPDQLEDVARIVSSYPQVTHNYSRDHEYNLWFTLVCEGTDKLNRLLEEIKRSTGVRDMVCLPAKRVFKIKVDFELL